MQKVIRTTSILALALLLAVGIAVFGLSASWASAEGVDTFLTLDLSSTEWEYGQVFAVGDIPLSAGRLYGNVDGTVFAPATQADGDYYIELTSLTARLNPREDGSEVSALSADGRVKLTIPSGSKTVNYYLSGNGTSGNSSLYTTFAVYDKDGNPTSYAVNKTGEQVVWTIKPRPISVTLRNLEELQGYTEEVDGETLTYIPKVYGSEALQFEFGSVRVDGLVFGAEISGMGTIEGNDDRRESHVGDYPITTPTTITLDGVDVTPCYSVNTSAKYVLKVVPATIALPAVERYATYTAAEGADGSSALAFCIDRYVSEFLTESYPGQWGEDIVRVKFDVDPSFDPYVEGKEEQLVVEMGPQIIRIASVECGVLQDEVWTPLEYQNYTVSQQDLPESYILHVMARLLTAYDPQAYDELPEEYDEQNWVEVSRDQLTAVYGRLYRDESLSLGNVIAEGAELSLTGSIKDIDVLLDGSTSVRLPVAQYELQNLVVSDPHYSVKADPSLLWRITPYLLTYADVYSFTVGQDQYADVYALSEESSFTRYLGDKEGLAVAAWAYDTDTAALSSLSSTLTLTTGFDETVTFGLFADVTPLPGYHPVERIAEAGKTVSNYSLADNTLYFKVNSLLYSVDVTSKIYNGAVQEVEIVFDGGFPSDPFADMGGSVTCKYSGAGNQPVDAGTYQVTVSARQPQGYVSTNLPYYQLNGSNTKFNYVIDKCHAVAHVEMKKTSRAFAEPVGIGAICSIKVTDTDGNPIRDANGQDRSASISAATCLATDASKMPGDYPVKVTLTDSNFVLDEVVSNNNVPLSCKVDYMSYQALRDTLSVIIDSKTPDSISVKATSYKGIPLSGVALRYLGEEDEDWIEARGLTIGSLVEGGRYTLQLYMNASDARKYLGTSTAIEGATYSVATVVNVPLIEQVAYGTTATDLAVRISNHNPDFFYSVLIDGDEWDESDVVIKDDLVTVKGLDAESEYYVTVMVRVNEDDSGLESDQLVAYTRAVAPPVKTLELRVTSTYLKVPQGYVYYVVPYDVDGKATKEPMSWQAACALPNSPLDEDVYLEAMEGGIDGSEQWTDVVEGQNYLMIIWREADPDFSDLPSDVTVYWVKAETVIPAMWQGAMEYVSKYMLIGVVGLMAVLTVVLAVVFAAKKKKLSKR